MKRDSASDTKLRFIRCPHCGLANLRGQPLCGHCKRRLPDFDELQQAIDESPRLQKVLRSLRRAQRRRKKIRRAVHMITGRTERPNGFYVALSAVPGLGHIVKGNTAVGSAHLAAVALLMTLVWLFFGKTLMWLPVTLAVLTHTYSVCDLLNFRPKNAFASLILTVSIWTVLAAGLYLPALVLCQRWVDLGEMAVPELNDRKLFGYACIALPMLGGCAAMASAYYNAKSRQLR